MNWRNTPERYGTLSITLHWLMLALLVAVYACIELREIFPKGSPPREAMKGLHFLLGLSVLALVVVRLVAYWWSGPPPQIRPAPPRWQALSSKAMHAALYLFMLAMPVAGWLIVSAEGDPIPYFGWQLPALIGANHDLAKQIEELHETGGTIGYFLVGAHAAAALFHHYFIRDNTLRRMLPGRG